MKDIKLKRLIKIEAIKQEVEIEVGDNVQFKRHPYQLPTTK